MGAMPGMGPAYRQWLFAQPDMRKDALDQMVEHMHASNHIGTTRKDAREFLKAVGCRIMAVGAYMGTVRVTLVPVGSTFPEHYDYPIVNKDDLRDIAHTIYHKIAQGAYPTDKRGQPIDLDEAGETVRNLVVRCLTNRMEVQSGGLPAGEQF